MIFLRKIWLFHIIIITKKNNKVLCISIQISSHEIENMLANMLNRSELYTIICVYRDTC